MANDTQEGPFLIGGVSGAARGQLEDELLALAERCMHLRPPSVMDKERLPPSGDKHDWVNLADYSWPNPRTSDGLPYVNRDGEANPEAKLYDRRRYNALVLAVVRLGAAWHVTGRRGFADKAMELVRRWFVDPETAMNPHLRYAHHTPGAAAGRKDGLIVFCSSLPSVLDIWLALHCAGLTDENAHAALRSWCEQFLAWYLTDPMSLAHAQCGNNHSSYHDLLAAHLMLFVGRFDEARGMLAQSFRERFPKQVGASGEQPMETGRTLSAQYSLYNLRALMSLAKLGDAVGLDGWGRQQKRPPILRATAFLYRHAVGDTPWLYQQIEPPNWWFLVPLCAVANRVYGCCLDTARIPQTVPAEAVPRELAVFIPGWELLFSASHQQHLPDLTDR